MTEIRSSKIAELVREIIALHNRPAVFVAKFWRDFHILSPGAANAAKAFTVGSFSLLFLLTAPVRAQQPLEPVVLVVLSQSVTANGTDGRSEFQTNVVALQ